MKISNDTAASISGVIASAPALLSIFGIHLTPEQGQGVMALGMLLLGFFSNRGQQ